MRAARFLSRVVLAGVVGASAAGCGVFAFQPVEGAFDRTLTVGGPVDLDIRTGAGGVHIRSGPVGSVRVVAHIRAYAMDSADATARVRRIEATPPIEQDGNAIRVGHIADSDLYRNVAIGYDVTVPEATRVHSVAGSGGQTIRGPLQGPVRIEDTSGDVQATTGSGGVRLTGVRGAVRARTGSGGIRIEGQPVRPWNLRAGSGGIRVSVTGDTPFEVDASAGSGGVSSAQTVNVTGERSKQRLRGTIRGGGPLVQLETGSGGIRID